MTSLDERTDPLDALNNPDPSTSVSTAPPLPLRRARLAASAATTLPPERLGAPAPLRFPVYIPTRGRPHLQHTVATLLALGISPTIVTSEDEVPAHRAACPGARVIPIDPSFHESYERTPELDPHPTTGAAHNAAWSDARQRGFTHHWILDDNIYDLFVSDRGRRYRATRHDPLNWVEDWATKWSNLAGVALIQHVFMRSFATLRPFIHNTKLYCATLYRNDLHHSGLVWRRGINDDTIVSLDLLKAGWCTATSTLVGINKAPTGTASGSGRQQVGGMGDVYRRARFEGKMSELVRAHPDCCKASYRFQRMHHHCDYTRFTQRLAPAPPGYWDRIDLSE